MSNAWIIFKQTGIMFIYMAVGFALFRAKLITREGSASMASLLLYAVIPTVIVQSFYVNSSGERIRELFLSILAGLVLLLLSMAVSHILFRRNPINDFGTAFSNAGFMGFPLITALLGQDAVFYAAGFVALLNALQWTYGQYLLSGDKRDINIRKILKNPIVLAFIAGLILFLGGIKLPSVASSAIAAISSMNAPLAMIVLGVYLAQMDAKEVLCDRTLYAASAVRLVVIPLLSFVVLYLIPGISWTMKSTLFIAAMAPVGSNVAVYAQRQGKNYAYAVGLVCLSTILSIITMPALIILIDTMR